MLGTVRGGLLHPAFAGVSQVLICVFGGGGWAGILHFLGDEMLAAT